MDWRSKDSNDGFGSFLSTVDDADEANRIVCWEDVGSFLNLSFFSSLSAFLFWESVSKRVVRFWMLLANEPRVLSEGPVTPAAAGAIGAALRICFSSRSKRYCWTIPLFCGMDIVGGILLFAAPHKKYRIRLHAVSESGKSASAA